MSTAALTRKGRITIPVIVRRALNVEAGDRVEFLEIEPGRQAVRTATAVSRWVADADWRAVSGACAAVAVGHLRSPYER